VQVSREWGKARHRRRIAAALVAGLSASALVTGCGGGGKSSTGTNASGPTVAAKAVGTAVSLEITPRDGTKAVRPDTRVSLVAKGGTLSDVVLADAGGSKVSGTTNTDSTTWTANQALLPGTKYTVTGKLVDREGKIIEGRSTFTTVDVPKRKQLKAVNIAPLNGWTVGVGYPLSVGFNTPVKNRAAVEKALEVQTSPSVDGAWYWLDDETAHYRPKTYWASGTKVTLNANLAGVDAGGGTWGVSSRKVSFDVGRKQIIRVDVKKLQMKVERDGKVIKTFPVTSGKPGWETRNGIKVIHGKQLGKTWTNTAINAPETYRLYSRYALRMTQSGEFIHDAPWAMGNIGARRGSHGCVGMRPSDAGWVFRNTMIGDVVVVSGSPRPYDDLWNLYQDWNVPWAKWSKGNADKSGYGGA
jgi:lipoprotein-anchoring transpeptidase ErfK/SrfK